MASAGYTNVGEEWAQKWSFRQDTLSRDTSLEVLLYDDSTDTLSDSSDVGDVGTEPSDGNYARQTVTLDGADVTISQESGDIRAEATVTFDVTDSTGTVDAWGVLNDFQSDIVNSDGSATTHLISTATFEGSSKDLTNYDSLDITVRIDLN